MLKTNTILKSALVLLVLYTSFSYLLVYSVLRNGYAGVLCSFLFLALTAITAFARGRRILHRRLSVSVLLMLSFFLFMAVYQLIAANFSNAACYIGFVFLVLLFADTEGGKPIIPVRLMLGIYLFFLFSIFFQIIFPDFYKAIMRGILLGSEYRKVISWQARGYFAGFTHQIGTTGLFVSYAIPLLLYTKKKSTGKRLLLLAAYVGLILTGKRMFMLIAVVVPLTVMLCAENSFNRKLRRLLITVTVLLMLLLVIVQLPDQVLEFSGGIKRIVRALLGNEKDLTSGRLVLWKKAVSIFLEHPLFGAGIGKYELLSGAGTEAHNAFLQLLAETGITGTLLFASMLIRNAVRTARRLRKTGSTALKLSLYFQLQFFLYSFTGNTVTNIGEIAIYCLMLAPALAGEGHGVPAAGANERPEHENM